MSFGGCFTAAQEMEALKAGLASDSDPDRCRCRGRGWILADSDVWVQCPAHHAGQAHPEVEAYQDMMEDAYYDERAEETSYLRPPTSRPGPSGSRTEGGVEGEHEGSLDV
jgi:hypothetical protein